MEPRQKRGRYERIEIQLRELFTRTADPIARMATTVAVLHHKFDYFFWTGFYRLVDGELTVGPYQGSLACQVLRTHTGVCWAGVDGNQTILVPDVERFPGHIACDSRSRSEIVVPLRDRSGVVVGVLDVDSEALSSFDEEDARGLERIAALVYSA